MDSKSLINAIVLQIAEKIRDLSTIQGRVPWDKGFLSKSIIAVLTGQGEATVSSNMSYARAVHDGRKAIVIRPKKKRMLAWKPKGAKAFIFAKEVHQPAREGQPFLLEGAADMQSRGYDFLNPLLHEYVSAEIGEQIKDSIELNFSV